MHPTRNEARLAGIFWLLFVLMTAFSLGYARSRLIVFPDAAATADNIIAAEGLFRSYIAANLLSQIFLFCLGLAVFHLFRGVSRTLSTIFLASIVASVSIGTVNSLHSFGALSVLGQAEYLKAFGPDQLAALAMTFLRMSNFGQGLQEIFWAPYLFAFGLLIIKSGYLPRLFGILLIIMSLGYPINMFTKLLIPEFYPGAITEITMLLGAVGGIPTISWLLIMGAKARPPEHPAQSQP